MIIRGFRSLSRGYRPNFCAVSDTEDNVANCVMLESDGENALVEVADDWPEFVALEASISAQEIASTATIERIECGHSFGRMSLYHCPKIDSKSVVQSACCEKIQIQFENNGLFIADNETHRFIGRKFAHFAVELSSEYLFEKTFQMESSAITEKFTADGRLEYEDRLVQGKFYAYGGFYRYGVHPRQIETCVCRTVQDGREMSLRISPISELQSADIDVFQELIKCRGKEFVGIGRGSPSQKLSLYDDLKSGACSMTVKNLLTNETAKYISNAVSHISGTNIITINFIKEEK